MKTKIAVPLLLIMALLNFVDGLVMNLVLALGLVALAYFLFSSKNKTTHKDNNSAESEDRTFATDEAETIVESEKPTDDTEALTAPYINNEWVQFEDSISSILNEILLLVHQQFRPHSAVLFMPAANGAYQLRSHISESAQFLPDATVIPGEGFLGTYCKEGFPELILDDVGGRKLPYYSGKADGIKSLMVAPIGAVKASAFILVDSTEKNNFAKEDLAWLVDLGKIAGQLLYYSYLYKQHQLMHEQVNAISLLEKRLLMIENRNDLLDELLTSVGKLFPFARCTISTVADEHDRFAMIERILGESFGLEKGDRFSLDDGSLATMTFMNQQPLSRNFNGTTDYIFSAKDKTGNLASFAGLPLGRSNGIIFLESDRPDVYTTSIMNTLSRVVLVAGVALDKIRVLEQQENLAIRDGLTGLYNHRQFQHLLREAIARSHRLVLKSVEEDGDGTHYERREERQDLSLVLCDIDHFKLLNDNHGHRFGDEVLREIATTLESGIREGVDYAARYGGEEFTLVMFGSDGAQAVETANRIREKIASIPFTTPSGAIIHVTMSFGVAVYDKDAKRQEELIQKADKTLYRAKDKGRNRVELYGVSSGTVTTQIPTVK